MSHAQGALPGSLGDCEIMIKDHVRIEGRREKMVYGSISDAARTGPR